MRIVANRTGFYKVSMPTENITHVRYIIQSKDTSIALLQHYSVFAWSTWPDKYTRLWLASPQIQGNQILWKHEHYDYDPCLETLMLTGSAKLTTQVWRTKFVKEMLLVSNFINRIQSILNVCNNAVFKTRDMFLLPLRIQVFVFMSEIKFDLTLKKKSNFLFLLCFYLQ